MYSRGILIQYSEVAHILFPLGSFLFNMVRYQSYMPNVLCVRREAVVRKRFRMYAQIAFLNSSGAGQLSELQAHQNPLKVYG